MAIYRVIAPCSLKAGNQVRYAGTIYSVEHVVFDGPRREAYAFLSNGPVAHFVDEVTVVDATRSQAVLKRYA
jgi:hypothetical protein